MAINGQKDVEQTEPIELKLRDVSMFSITPADEAAAGSGKEKGAEPPSTPRRGDDCEGERE